MITEINEWKVNLIVENVIQIESWITINVDVSVKIGKNIIYAKKFIFGILMHVVINAVTILQVLLMTQ